MSIIQLLFSAKGRIRRRDYWLSSLGLGVVYWLLYIVGHILISGNPFSEFFTDFAGILSGEPTLYTQFVWGVILLGQWPAVCIMAKRWHDRNRSGWLAGVVLGISLLSNVSQILYGPQSASPNPLLTAILGFAVLAVSIWALIELGFLDGTKGPNKYGPSPKGIGGSADVF